MRVLALDLSTNTGWASLVGELNHRESVTIEKTGNLEAPPVKEPYPFNYVNRAMLLAHKLIELVDEIGPDYIIIEETNLGRNRYSQKMLEFIHFAFNFLWDAEPRPQQRVYYVSSSSWRSNLGLHLTKTDKKQNSRLARAKRKARQSGDKLDRAKLGIRGRINKKHVAIRFVNECFQLQLKVKDNDIADAICLGLSYFNGVTVCDGRI